MTLRALYFIAIVLACACICALCADTTMYATVQVGGTGGTAWDDKNYADVLNRPVRQIIVFSGKWVDSIQVNYDGGQQCPKHGGNGGTRNVFALEEGEFITKINVRYGTLVEQIQFCTTDNRCSPAYGSTSNSNGINRVLEYSGKNFAFFRGRSADMVDALQPVFVEAPPLRYTLTNVIYDLSRVGASKPIMLGSTQIRNLSPRDQHEEISIAYQRGVTKSWSHVTEFTVGVEVSVEVTAGIKGFGEASREFEASFSSTYKFNWGEAVTTSITGVSSAKVVIPACSEVEVVAEARSAEVNVPFTAMSTTEYKDGRKVQKAVNGQFSGVLVFDVTTQFGKESRLQC